MPGFADFMVKTLIKLRGSKKVFSDPAKVAARVEDRMLRPPVFGPSAKLERDVNISVSYTSGWPIYTVTPKTKPTNHVAIYAHGGAWINEIQPLQWRMVAELVAQSGATIIVPIYPLAPIGTAGSVVPKIADMVRDLIDTHGAKNVSTIGDSAGGQIILSAALLLRDRGIAPVQSVYISPALDLTLSNPDVDAVELRDPWLARAGVVKAVEYWRGDLSVTNQLVSPLLADLHDLGPMTVFSGTCDITNPDTRLFAAKADAAGININYIEKPDAIHVYPILPTPDGRAARRAIAALLT